MLTPFHTLCGFKLAAFDGEIGKVREFYFDDESWAIRYLIVETGPWLLGREVLIAPQSLAEVDAQGRTIEVKLTREEVRRAPLAETAKPISRQFQAELHRHYGWEPYWMTSGAGGGMILSSPVLALPLAAAPLPAVPALDEAVDSKENPHLRSSAELMSGYSLHVQDGEVGRVKDFVIDDATWEVRYLVIHTGVWFLGKDALLSPKWIERISYTGAEVFVNLPRSAIKEAPAYDQNAPLSRAFEQRLHDCYGHKGYWEAVG